MIEFTKAFKASDGKVYPSLEEAQAAELLPICEKCVSTVTNTAEGPNHILFPLLIARSLIEERSRIIDILTTNKSSRPRARKANGATKKRKTATAQTSETSPA